MEREPGWRQGDQWGVVGTPAIQVRIDGDQVVGAPGR